MSSLLDYNFSPVSVILALVWHNIAEYVKLSVSLNSPEGTNNISDCANLIKETKRFHIQNILWNFFRLGVSDWHFLD